MGAHMIHAKFQIVSSAGHRCMFVAREIWLCNLFLPCFQANSPTLGQFPALRRVAPGEMVRNRPQKDSGCRPFSDVGRSEERRVGKECVSTCRSRWSRHHKKKQK